MGQAKQAKKNRLPAFHDRMTALQKEFGGGTISGFAEYLGITRQTIGFYISGERLPDAEMINRICSKCGVSADWLLGMTERKTLNPNARTAQAYTRLSPESIRILHHAEQQTLSAVESCLSNAAGLNLLEKIMGYIEYPYQSELFKNQEQFSIFDYLEDGQNEKKKFIETNKQLLLYEVVEALKALDEIINRGNSNGNEQDEVNERR